MRVSYIAASLWRAFRIRLLISAIIVSLPAVLLGLLYIEDDKTTILVSGLEKLLSSLLFISFLRSVFAYLGKEARGSFVATTAVVLFFQLAWLLNHLPLFSTLATERLLEHVPNGANAQYGLTVMVILFSVIMLLWGARWYFSFVPLVIEGKNVQEAFSHAPVTTQFSRRNALLCIATALIISSCLELLIQIVGSGWRYVDQVAAISSGVYWLISSCLSVAIALEGLRVDIPESLLSAETILKDRAAPYFGAVGLGRYIVIMFALGALQMYQVTTAVPSGSYKIEKIQYDQKAAELTVRLSVSDPKGHFSNFQPLLLRVAGENGFALSGSTEVLEPKNFSEVVRDEPETVVFDLRFKIVNRADDFENLSDRFIWYGIHRLAPLNDSSIGKAHSPQPTEDTNKVRRLRPTSRILGATDA